MLRKRNRYVKPRKAYEKARISEENKLVEKYGLKNKKEIWKAKAKINYFRKRAMALAKLSLEEQEVLFRKLKEIGLNVNSVADVLGLNLENLLERRLPTVLHKKGLAKTAKEARQMVVHKRVSIGGRVSNIPSYIVRVSEESIINVKSAKPKIPKHTNKEMEVSNG